MGVHLDLRERHVGGRRLVLVFVGAGLAAAEIGKAEIHAGLVGAVELAGRLVVTHAVDLVVGEPERLVLRIEVHAHRVAHAGSEHLTVLAFPAHAHDAADAGLLVEVHLLRRVHVEGLSERDVELVVGPDAAHPGGVVVGFFLGRDQLALLHDDEGSDIGAFVEELGGGIDQHAVLLGDEEETILRETHAVGNGKADRGRELLDLVGDTILVAVGDRPHLALAGADERHHALRPDREMAGIRHDGIEPDLESARQLDAGEILLDRVRLGPGLRNLRDVHRRAGGLEVGQLFEIARGRRLRLGQSRPGQHERRGDAQQRVLHVFLPSSHCLLSLKHPMHHPTFFRHPWLFGLERRRDLGARRAGGAVGMSGPRDGARRNP